MVRASLSVSMPVRETQLSRPWRQGWLGLSRTCSFRLTVPEMWVLLERRAGRRRETSWREGFFFSGYSGELSQWWPVMNLRLLSSRLLISIRPFFISRLIAFRLLGIDRASNFSSSGQTFLGTRLQRGFGGQTEMGAVYLLARWTLDSISCTDLRVLSLLPKSFLLAAGSMVLIVLAVLLNYSLSRSSRRGLLQANGFCSYSSSNSYRSVNGSSGTGTVKLSQSYSRVGMFLVGEYCLRQPVTKSLNYLRRGPLRSSLGSQSSESVGSSKVLALLVCLISAKSSIQRDGLVSFVLQYQNQSQPNCPLTCLLGLCLSFSFRLSLSARRYFIVLSKSSSAELKTATALAMAVPIASQLWALKGRVFMISGLQYSPAEDQTVQTYGTLSWCIMVALAVLVFSYEMVKEQLQQRKAGLIFSMILGSMRARRYSGWPRGQFGPQAKVFLRREWPCRSRYSVTLPARCSLATKFLRRCTSGCISGQVSRNCRLRSTPAAEVRVLPSTTPSGLSMGRRKKWVWVLSCQDYWSQLLGCLLLPSSCWSSPRMRKELLASQGCTRAVTTTHCLEMGSD